MHLELLAHVVHVILNRGRFNPQLAAYLLVRQAAVDEMCNLQLAPGQRDDVGVTTVIAIATGTAVAMAITIPITVATAGVTVAATADTDGISVTP